MFTASVWIRRRIRQRIGRCARISILCGGVLASAFAVNAQPRRLTLGDIYDPSSRINFSGETPGDLAWIDDGRYRRSRTAGGAVGWFAVDAVSGSERPLFDAARAEAALVRLGGGGGGADVVRRAVRSRAAIFNHAHDAVVFTVDRDLYLYSIVTDRAERLTDDGGRKEDEDLVSFSPDDKRLAFVRGNNLHAVDLNRRRARALTSDGGPKILNGKLDWVYEEEIYGRGERGAYWWSPDSTRLAFLRLDDTPVPTYVVVDDIPYGQEVERWDYPKAGDPNPDVRLGVVPAAGGAVQWVDLSRYPAADRLVVHVGWTPDSAHVVYSVQNRVQTWLDLNTIAVSGRSAPRTLFRETSRAWIDPGDMQPPLWLRDGTFLWLSPRSGWRHVYRYEAGGALRGPVTGGASEVRALHGVDRSGTWMYFSGTGRSHIGGDVFRVRLDGSGLERLSQRPGTHAARFNPGLTHFIDTWSDMTTPPQVRLHGSEGAELRVIEENRVDALGRFRLSSPELMQVPTRDGFVMEAVMIKPPDFDPSRKYPVYQFTYGGPHSPQVRDAWGGSQYMFHQLLAQHGIIVWICDNRSASGKGAESAWSVARNFGESELRDIEDGLAWLRRQPYVDGGRIGIHGWSYGGYMTSYALTHSTSFVMGIAGGTVADWRTYDSVYTERFMGLPEENAEGYRKSSPRWAASSLHGALMLIHGAMDDNVHAANTMQFAYELQKANKPFRLMLYPKSRHGVTDSALVHHMRSMMLSFILEHLRPEPTPAGGPATTPVR